MRPSSTPPPLQLLPPSPSECAGQLVTQSPAEPLGDPGLPFGHALFVERFTDYLNIIGVQSLCIPREFGGPVLNVDWNDLDDPPLAIGRMISIGFEGLAEGAYGWGRGYIVYSTYDFEVGSEYDTFATREDLLATRSRSIPRMITVDGVDGFTRFKAGRPLDTQAVYITYVFPFDGHYVAAVLSLGLYDPTEVDDVLLQTEEGRHPQLHSSDVSLFGQLVSSIQFE